MTLHYKNFAPVLVFFFMALTLKPAFSSAADSELTSKLECSIFNFHEIEPGFYRSGRIPPENCPDLKAFGIKTVINFIDRKKESSEEEARLHALGIETVWIPWNGFDYPKDEYVEKFLQTVRDSYKRPILVHCKRGAERTGLMIACWRIAEKGWAADQALEEMRKLKFREFWYGHLKKYIYNFAKRYGQTANYSNNIFTRMKTNLLYAVYRVRKLNPFH